ncbi:hypothetical protein B5M09_002152 [Aphanomyces astaci]|uniref:Uncharacterized protein n=1 Tax=Aphanomyces astaci TaxID=112090 RepID=A0A3R7WJJ1_APHAT|nr:hypothetical protein B5M09_002152 [Aphanomyces astaci]
MVEARVDLKPRDESQNALEFSDSDASDDDDNEDEYGGDAKTRTNNKRSVESFSNSNNSSVDEAKQLDDGDTEVERFEPSPARPAPKQPVSDYFDDDADEFPKKPTAAVSSSPPKLAPSSSTVRADNNFVTEDWDDNDDPHVIKESKAAPAPHAGVASDANFVTEDWD